MDRTEMAAVLRRARERVHPADVGLPAGARRRVSGLRREEVAQLAGISVDYVVRLEQGRGPHPSESVLTGLARALRLDDDERDTLFLLAGAARPLPGQIVSVVRPGVQRMLERLSDLPVLVLDAKSDIIAWNPLAAALLGDFTRWPRGERNIAWQRFLGSPGRVSLTDEEAEATESQTVGSLRAATARYPDDADLRRLVARLRSGSRRFESLWHQGRSAQWRNHHKTIVHPELGPLHLDCDTLLVPDDDQAVVVYSAAADTPESSALSLLKVMGTQQVATAR